jgi:hypothetical protein
MTPDVCKCLCHETERGIFNAARQMQNYTKAFTHAGRKQYHEPPPVTDIIEAAAACPRCLDRHAAALIYEPPRGTPPRARWQDSDDKGEMGNMGDATGEGGE